MPWSPSRTTVKAGVVALAVLAALAAGATALVASATNATHGDVVSKMVDKTAKAHPNALWHIVHGLCVPDEKTSGHPAPCAAVDLAEGYAVLKDIQGATQYLLIPTVRITGIESPRLLTPGSPNYWQAAWTARRMFESRVGHGVPRQDIGLAVNSISGRSQNQLHIHIDCVRAEVRDALWAHVDDIRADGGWVTLPLGAERHLYRVRWIPGADLDGHDPFKILAETDPSARADMGNETLAVIGAVRTDGDPGFFMLSDRADASGEDIGASEEMLDHRCGVLTDRAPNSEEPATGSGG